MQLNGQEILLESRTNIVCLPNTHINRILVSPDAKLTVVKISNRLVQELMHNYMEQWNRAFYIAKSTVAQSSDELIRQIQFYYELIMSKLHEPWRPYHKEIMRTIIRALLFEVLSYSEVAGETDSQIAKGTETTPSHQQVHFKAFLDLLSRTAVKHQTVEHYAAELCITPKYLTTICTQCSHKSAHQWITDMTNEDIRHLLLTTDLSIKEVSQRLGFENTSFFGKYVKKHFGMTPMQVRMQ